MQIYCVLFKNENLPTTKTWQQTLEQLGHPLKLDWQGELAEVDGDLPCYVEDQFCGIHVCLEPVSETEQAEKFKAISHEYDTVGTFMLEHQTRSYLPNMYAMASLAIATNGKLYSPESNEYLPAEQVNDWAQQQIAKYRSMPSTTGKPRQRHTNSVVSKLCYVMLGVLVAIAILTALFTGYAKVYGS